MTKQLPKKGVSPVDDEEWRRGKRAMYDRWYEEGASYEAGMLGIPGKLLFERDVFPANEASGGILTRPAARLIMPGEAVLDMGTGPGNAAIAFALRGAYPVVATDINPAAVANAKKNVARFGLNIDVRLGSLFEPIRPGEAFDAIYWNHPFSYAEEPVERVLDLAGYDYRYQALEGFIAGAKQHLTQNGRVLLGTGRFARLDLIHSFAERYGYDLEIAWQSHEVLAAISSAATDFMIYKFVPVR